MYKVLNKQIEYPLLGTFSGSLYGTSSYASKVNWGNITGSINSQSDLFQNFITSSSLSGLVPYTGASSSVNLGNYSITSTGITLQDNIGSTYVDLTLAGSSNVNNLYIRNQRSSGLLAIQDGGFNFLLGCRKTGDGGMFIKPDVAIGVQVQYPTAKLQVRGTSATIGNALLVENSTPTTLFTILNSGKVGIGNFTPTVALECNTTIRAWTSLELGQFGALSINTNSVSKTATGSDFFSFTNTGIMSPTSGNFYFLNLNFNSFAPQAGSANYSILQLTGVLNQAVTVNGIIRGVYYNPTVTSVFGTHNAWESTSGNMVVGGTSSKLMVNTTTSWGSTQGLFVGTSTDARIGVATTTKVGIYLGQVSNQPQIYAYDYINNVAQNLVINSFGGYVGIGNIIVPAGMLHIKGDSATVNTALLVQNSTPSSLLAVLNNGEVNFGNNGAIFKPSLNGFQLGNGSANYIAAVSGASSGITISGESGTGTFSLRVNKTVSAVTSGNHEILQLNLNGGFQPISGNANLTLLNFNGVINQTGSANGTIRGIYYNPVITSALGTHNAWESTSGNMIIGGGKIQVPNIDLIGGSSNVTLTMTGSNGIINWTNGAFAIQYSGTSMIRLGNNGYHNLVSRVSIGGSISITPTATLQVRGESATVGTALLVENSTPTTLFSVSNAGLSTFNPVNASGDAIEVTNGGYIKYGTVRFRGSGSGFFFYDSAVASFFSTTTTLTTSKSPIVQGNYSFSNLGSGFGAAYFSIVNSFSAILGGYLNGIEVKNTYNPSNGVGGIFRDIYIAPVSLGVNVQDWRGIEIVSPSTTVATLVKLNNGTTDIFCVKGDTTKGKISFFGATPATQQTLGAATAGASYTATEQAMIQKAYDLLRTFGLGN